MIRTTLVVSSFAIATPALADSSLPWQLRPLTLDNEVSLDSRAAAFNDANGNLDVASSTVLGASYKLTPHWAPMIRLGFVGNDAPGAALDGAAFGNPILGATYVRAAGRTRIGAITAMALPLGTGGTTTDAAAATARPTDQAMFEVEDATAIAGADVAYVDHGFTAQLEATVMQGVRVRGAGDRLRTNSAFAAHVGTFLGDHVSIGADVRYQRWLSPTDAMTPVDSAAVAVGVRVHFAVGEHARIHPGLSLTRGLDHAPLLSSEATAIEVSLPVTF